MDPTSARRQFLKFLSSSPLQVAARWPMALADGAAGHCPAGASVVCPARNQT
jgi:hypothetical protein